MMASPIGKGSMKVISEPPKSEGNALPRGRLCRREFAALGPEVDGEGDGNQREDAAKFVDKPGGLSGVARDRSKKSLDIEVVAAVKDCAGPKTAGFEAHPGKNKTHRDDHDGEACKAIPGGSAGVVVAVNQDGIVPERPDDAANERGCRE